VDYLRRFLELLDSEALAQDGEDLVVGDLKADGHGDIKAVELGEPLLCDEPRNAFDYYLLYAFGPALVNKVLAERWRELGVVKEAAARKHL